MASPCSVGAPEHEDDLVIPAREGRLRILRAAREVLMVRTVVVTISMAAIGHGYGDEVKTKIFSEED